MTKSESPKSSFLHVGIFQKKLLLLSFTTSLFANTQDRYVPLIFDASLVVMIPYNYKETVVIVDHESKKQTAINTITAYAEDEQTHSAPTLNDYMNAGIHDVTASTLNRINIAIALKYGYEVNTLVKIQEVVDNENSVISGDKIIAYAKDGSNTPPTSIDYKRVGIKCVRADNINTVNSAIRNQEGIYSKYSIQQVANAANYMEPIILDNDAFDPDWVIMLTSALGLEEQCEASVRAVVLTGRDANKKQGMLYSSILSYYGRQDIPLGLNTHQIMRYYAIDATANEPLHTNYKGTYLNIDEFTSDQCTDYEICVGRNASTPMLCTILSQAREKVSWVVGGHLHNVANLLRETQACNGKELIAAKVKQIVISSGWTNRTNGRPEMNLSEGTTRTNSASDASKYVFANRPANVPIVMASVPNSGTLQSRVGDLFLKDQYNDSPMSFILSVDRYGIYGDHGLSDTEALMYAVQKGVSSSNITYAQKIKTCLNINNYGAVTIGNNCQKEDYYLEKTRSDYASILSLEVSERMSVVPTSRK